MKNLLQGLVYCLLSALLCTQARAENDTAYIVDELLVGIHQEKDIDSPIIKVIGTGTELEILERDGDYTKVKEKEGGKTGWVDSSYVMQEKPAKLLLSEFKKKMQSQGSDKKDTATANEDNAALTEELESLKQQLSSEKLKYAELEAIISDQEKRLAQFEAHSDISQVKELQKKNDSLKKALKDIKNKETSSDRYFTEILKLFADKFVLIALAVAAILGFVFGRHIEDRKNRKRHGGFRI